MVRRVDRDGSNMLWRALPFRDFTRFYVPAETTGVVDCNPHVVTLVSWTIFF